MGTNAERAFLDRHTLHTNFKHFSPVSRKQVTVLGEKNIQLLTVITQHLSGPQKYLTGPNPNFSEVNANLPPPRSERSCTLVRSGHRRCSPDAHQTLCDANPLTGTESFQLTSLAPEPASTSPPLTQGDGGQILSPSYTSHLVHISYQSHVRLQRSDSWGKGEEEE